MRAIGLVGFLDPRQQKQLEEQAAKKAALDALPLLERNTILLTELESEWAALGPKRLITFKASFHDEDVARKFGEIVADAGFITNIRSEGFKLWFVDAIREMAPLPADVTHWEEWFEARATECCILASDGSLGFTGWNYPARHTPPLCARRSCVGPFS